MAKSKSSIKRILNQFKNISIDNISLIQSNYQNKNYFGIKNILNLKSNNIEYLKAIGRLASQYIRLLSDASTIEAKILKSENSLYIRNNYENNLIVFKNKKGSIDYIQPKSNIIKENILIKDYTQFLMFVDNFYSKVSKYNNIERMRIVIRYNLNINENKFISTKITSKLSELHVFLQDLPFFISELEQYSDLINYELAEIIIYYYLNEIVLLQ